MEDKEDNHRSLSGVEVTGTGSIVNVYNPATDGVNEIQNFKPQRGKT